MTDMMQFTIDDVMVDGEVDKCLERLYHGEYIDRDSSGVAYIAFEKYGNGESYARIDFEL